MQLKFKASLVCALLCMAHAVGVPQATLARRLTSDLFAPACLTACPDLSGSRADIEAHDNKYEESVQEILENDAPTKSVQEIKELFEESLSDQYALMCKNQDAFVCAKQNLVECSDEGSTKKGIDCFCTDCPNLAFALGGGLGFSLGLAKKTVAELVVELGNVDEQQVQLLTALCPAIGPVKCGNRTANCRSEVDDFQMILDLILALEPECISGGYELEVAGSTCASAALGLLGTVFMAVASVVLG